jgi:hypothetical protein
MKSLMVSLMAVVGLLTVVPLASANLLTNGSFETPTVPAGGFTTKKGFRAVMPLLFLLLIFAIPAVAQALSLPPAKYAGDAYAGTYLLPSGGSPQLSVPGTVTDMSNNGFNSSMAIATLAGTPVPLASADANSMFDAAVASAGLVYYMEITGPPGVSPVTVDVTAFSSASASGDASAGGAFEIQQTSNSSVVQSWFTCASTIDPTACSGLPTAINVNAVEPLFSNTLYAIEVTAAGSAGGCLSPPCPLGTGDGRALTDPSFAIDPSTPDAGLYSLVFSDGIGNPASPPVPPPSPAVPEPSTLLLLGSGLAGLGGLAWRRHRRR